MNLPNLFIIGAPKAGTTALYESLRQHPEIYLSPVKEPFFFAFEGQPPVFAGPAGTFFRRVTVWRPEDYARLFSSVCGQRVIGEGSTIYLRSTLAARRIRKSIPHARLVAILRQPAERAYSSYLYHRFNEGVEPARDFVQALALESRRQEENWSSFIFHRSIGYYYAQLRIYFELFPREQIKIYLHEDLKAAPQVVLRDLFRFLEVDEKIALEIKERNITRYPRIHTLHRLITHPARMARWLMPLPPSARGDLISSLRRWNTRYNLTTPPPLDPEIRARLTRDYREDILKLQDLIRRDLSHWLET